MPVDVSNCYSYIVSVTNPGNKAILQLQAVDYKILSILQIRMSQRKQDVDEFITWAISRVNPSDPYTLPSTPTFNTEVNGFQYAGATSPGFITSAQTMHGIETGTATLISTPYIQTFHVKIGELWLPPVDPITKETRPLIIQPGEIWAIRFPVAPGNREIDLIVDLQEG